MSWWDPDAEDTLTYRVVLNHEEQYSIWPAHKEIPSGWRAGGTEGSKEHCLAHIENVWTDMRPLSLRKYMEELAKAGPQTFVDEPQEPEDQPTLVDRLCADQTVLASCRPANTAAELKAALDRGFVHVKFPATGTELGMRLLPQSLIGEHADFEQAKGEIHWSGELTLDFVPLRFSGGVDLATLEGKGRLERR